MKYALLIYVIGWVGYILFNLRRIGRVEESIGPEGIDVYFKVTIWWIMMEAILWFVWFSVFIFCNIIRPEATKEEYDKQKQ